MANTKEELMDQLEWRTQECAVLITDTKETSYGSGVLYYPKDSSRVYVFTCAHVLDELTEPFVIRFFCSCQQGDRRLYGAHSNGIPKSGGLFA